MNEKQEQSAEQLKRENELLYLQLTQVQEELESCYLKLQKVASDHFDLESRTLTAESDKEKMERHMQRILENNRILKEKAQSRGRQLDAIHGSFSWKITKPLRFAARLVRGK